LGLHRRVVASLVVSHEAPIVFLSVSLEIVRIFGPSWFSPNPRTDCDPPA
jgi:hypothetical protein